MVSLRSARRVNGKPAFEKISRLGMARPVRIAAQIEIGIAQDRALHVDGRGVVAVLLAQPAGR